MEKLKHAEWYDDCCFLDVSLTHGYLIIPLVEIQLGEKCGTGDSGGEIREEEDNGQER